MGICEAVQELDLINKGKIHQPDMERARDFADELNAKADWSKVQEALTLWHNQWDGRGEHEQRGSRLHSENPAGSYARDEGTDT